MLVTVHQLSKALSKLSEKYNNQYTRVEYTAKKDVWGIIVRQVDDYGFGDFSDSTKGYVIEILDFDRLSYIIETDKDSIVDGQEFYDDYVTK